jgi:HEPN domain-containing protein
VYGCVVPSDQNRIECDRWMRQAERDLEAAGANAKGGFFEWACFLSQQAAEKALKAFLYLQGERAVVGHSVQILIKRAAAYAPDLADLHPAKRLDEVYIPSRYPNGLEDSTPGEFYSREDAESCTALAARVIARVRGRITS